MHIFHDWPVKWSKPTYTGIHNVAAFTQKHGYEMHKTCRVCGMVKTTTFYTVAQIPEDKTEEQKPAETITFAGWYLESLEPDVALVAANSRHGLGIKESHLLDPSVDQKALQRGQPMGLNNAGLLVPMPNVYGSTLEGGIK